MKTPRAGRRQHIDHGLRRPCRTTLDGVNVADAGAGQYWILSAIQWFQEIQVGGLGAAAEYGGFTHYDDSTVCDASEAYFADPSCAVSPDASI